MSVDEYKNNIHRLFEAINQHNLDVYDELYQDNCVFHGTPPMPDSVGLEPQKEYMKAFFAAYPDAHFTMEEILISGDSIATRWRYEATHTGETPARRIPPTGKKVVVTACSVNHVKDGKITDEWIYTDQSALLQQLGVLPTV